MSCPTPSTDETRSAQTCLPSSQVPHDELVRFFVSASLGDRAVHFSDPDSAVQAARGFFPDTPEEDLRAAALAASKIAFAV